MLSDLRESGAIEQDADLVIFINRPEYYGGDRSSPGRAEIIIAKHRNGEVGDVNMVFIPSEIKFVDEDHLSIPLPEMEDEYEIIKSGMNNSDFTMNSTEF